VDEPGQTGELKHGVLGLGGDAFAQSFALLSLALASSLATSLVAADAGVAAPWAYIVAGAASLCLASVIIRFTRRVASAGGVYTYSARGLGSGGGFIAGWLYAGGFAAGISFVMIISGFFMNQVMADHVGIHLGGDGWFWWFLILMALLTGIALVDVRISTRTQST
jgi:amino acid transporter